MGSRASRERCFDLRQGGLTGKKEFAWYAKERRKESEQ